MSQKRFLEKYYKSEIKSILESQVQGKGKPFVLVLDFMLYLNLCPNEAYLMLQHQSMRSSYFDAGNDNLCKAAIELQFELQSELQQQLSNSAMAQVPPKIKSDLCIRWKGISSRLCSITIVSTPTASDINRFVTFQGTATRVGIVKIYEKQKCYQCSKCSAVYWSDYNLMLCDYPKPLRCEGTSSLKPKNNSGKGGKSNDYCGSTSFKLANTSASGADEGNWRELQELKIQEHVSNLKLGRVPKSVCCLLENDLVDSVRPGDNVVIYGVVKRRWPLSSFSPGQKVFNVDNIIVANSVGSVDLMKTSSAHNSSEERLNSEFRSYWDTFSQQDSDGNSPLAGRNNILKSICQDLHGMYILKLALALILIGGSNETSEHSYYKTNIRTVSHMLLVGDPGTGKSQLLKFASKLSHRSVLTTGIGSTTAGLTCSAVKEGSEWQLEAGALVLADGGICCIDEFGSIRESDKTAIHEAMEQQTLSVAKAGLVCKLNTRCSVIAATNPKGKYDSSVSIEANLALGSPLLSRFDLIFLMLDTQNGKWDREVSSFILNREITSNYERKSSRNLEGTNDWSLEKLKSYISYCKRKYEPEITEEAKLLLSNYYQYQRQTDLENTSRITIRLLESLIRLAQAHAKFMCKNSVERMDAVVAIQLLEASILSTNMIRYENITLNNIVYMDFPENPDEEMVLLEKRISERLE